MVNPVGPGSARPHELSLFNRNLSRAPVRFVLLCLAAKQILSCSRNVELNPHGHKGSGHGKIKGTLAFRLWVLVEVAVFLQSEDCEYS